MKEPSTFVLALTGMTFYITRTVGAWTKADSITYFDDLKVESL